MSTRWTALVRQRRANHRAVQRVLNSAHRGARAVAPENTLEAIARAAELGADMVEIDVHLSTDGEPIVTHDLEQPLTLAEIARRHPHIPTLSSCLIQARLHSLLVNI